MTESRLFRVFDLQRFAENKRLQGVIDAAHRRQNDRELSDEEMDLVAAAGTPEPAKRPEGLSK